MASLLYGLAGKLAGELCSPLFKDYVGKPWELGTKSEFEKLKNTVSAIEAVLLDAEEKQRTNRQVQDWLIKIKLVFYDLEDLLQEVRTEDLERRAKTKNKRAKKVRIFFSHSNQLKYRLKMGRKVKLIRERMDAIASDSKRFNFAQLHKEMPENSHRREETHSYIPIEKFIGRDADKEHVTSLLLQSDVVDKVSVVSVIGIGGMGKTTLAQSVYNSHVVKSKFELRMWVCVSDPFDVKLICENIITSVASNRCDRLPMEIVKEKLKSSIDGKKYLLVLDDVWNDKQMEWEKLEVLLAGGARGSKILITARAELVARAAKSIATHVLKGLTSEESWVLFKQIAFQRGVQTVSPTIKGIGKEVLVKCAGVPLVVKAMGSILALKEKEIDWLDFKKYDLPRVFQDSEGTVLPILRLSYDYLSAPLKRCFVYCAIYPKDYEIEKEELIGMWVAHGLIQLDGTRRSIEDVGERHFMDLLYRSFFEVDENGYYKMHDLIHDLAQSVGGDEYFESGAKCMVKSTRHAWISGDELTNIVHGSEKLHTLVVIGPYNKRKFHHFTSSTFLQLRVLSLRRLGLLQVPQFVGGLRHLYYLDLSDNNFFFLPESICSLYNLQTLILSECSYLLDLLARTRDLGNLRRLDITGCDDLRYMPRGLEELTCLQTLNYFVCPKDEGGLRGEYAEVCELKSLVNLRGSLKITNLRGSLANAKCERKRSCILGELKLITQLELRWHYDRYGEELKEEEEEAELLLIESLKPHPNLERLIIEQYPGRKFPSWMDSGVSLPNIVSIQLEYCQRLRHLPALGLLPSLQKLYLVYLHGIEHLIDSSRNTTVEGEVEEPLFPSLKELHLKDMIGLKRVVEPTESSRSTTYKKKLYFPVLEKLMIEECPLFLADGSNDDGKLFASHLALIFMDENTEAIPSGLQYLPHLQTLKLRFCTNLVSLPDWMGNLTSLQELHLRYLHSLASIPDCLQSLTSLQRLVIKICPKLESRCEKETRVDWHKIAHIPHITIDGELLSHSESEKSEVSSSSREESKDQNEEHELLDLSPSLTC